jgi:hypothetical protein
VLLSWPGRWQSYSSVSGESSRNGRICHHLDDSIRHRAQPLAGACSSQRRGASGCVHHPLEPRRSLYHWTDFARDPVASPLHADLGKQFCLAGRLSADPATPLTLQISAHFNRHYMDVWGPVAQLLQDSPQLRAAPGSARRHASPNPQQSFQGSSVESPRE